MKSILYGTTALFAVGLMAGTAVASEKIKLGLGGYWRGMIQVGSNDADGAGGAGDGLRDHGFGQESEIYFSGKTKLDNGITITAAVQLEGETTGDQIDNTWITASGGFGTVHYGETWGPSLLMVGGGVGEKNHTGDFASFNAGVNLNGLGLNSFIGGAGLNGRPSPKLAYYTPRVSGFQAGVSYAPEKGNAFSNGARAADLGGGVGNELVDVGVNFVNKVAGANVRIGLVYFTSETEPADSLTASAPDVDGHGLGVQVSMGGVKLGGRYAKLEDRGGSGLDRTNWRIGADYGMGPWSVGVTYQVAVQDFVGADDKTTYFSIGANYNVAPGVSFFGGILNYDFEDSTNAAASEGDNSFGILGTKLSF
ncbi:MAG: porin [Alphaproteobacteria bacterium]